MTGRRPAKGAPREFNPAALVQLVAESLAYRHGIEVAVDAATVVTAVNAAADLLRALHITPTAVPSAGRAAP